MSNASRTLLLNIHTLEWDTELLNYSTYQKQCCQRYTKQEVFENSYNPFSTKIPIAGLPEINKQLYLVNYVQNQEWPKNTYGTGCFMLMNTGKKPVYSNNNLLTTVAWKINGKTTYALEGSVL
jgi:glycerol kinase